MRGLSEESPTDPWAWLHDLDEDARPDYSSFHVVAGVLPERGEPYTTRCLQALATSSVPVDEIRTDLPPDAAGDWFWVLPDDVEPAPGTLAALLDRVLRQPDAAVVGALLIEPRRRGAGTLVSNWAQTISASGRLRPLTEPGELYQGQLDAVAALGVPAQGMLVRGDAWRFLGGLNELLPRSHRGLDFGWRANLAGYRVVAEPRAQLVDHSGYGDPADERAAGLALVSAHSRPARRWLTFLRLVLVTLLTAAGFLLGKDPGRAGEELRGLGRWLSGRRLRHSVRDSLASLPVTPASRRATSALRPGRWSGLRRAAEQVAARLTDWVRTFTGRGAAVSLDEMTGDDFASTGTTRHRLPLVVVGLVALLVGALVAARQAYGEGLLTAAQLLAAPDDWTGLVAGYLEPVPGATGAAGAPWAALAGVFSLATLGRPDWLVSAAFLLAVPLAWLMAFRLLRQLVADRRLAAIGALAYALAPALLGALNAGAFGLALLAVLLPILGYSCWRWQAEGDWSWRRAGAVAFWLLLACALAPSLWAAALVAAVLTSLGAGRRVAWLQWAVVLATPALLLVGPWGGAVLRHPGRLLTGIEPGLAPVAAPEAWSVLVGHTLGESGPPLWLSITFFCVCWVAALAAAARRPEQAGRALACAGLVALVAIGLTRLVVEVPPAAWARPQALEWQLALVAALVLAACAGLDGVLVELQGRELGLRHLLSLALAAVAALAMLLAAGWWVLAGQVGTVRTPVGDVPAFVRNAQLSETPGRTLAMAARGDGVRWALLEGDFARLGDTERGTAFAGDPAANQLAASVVARLAGGNADDQLVPDLVRLGVAHVTLEGGAAEQRMAINNVPGLELGTGDANLFVWPVPGSAVAVVEATTGERTPVGDGVTIATGAGDRTLRLAQPADRRWLVRVGGATLAQVPGDGPGTSFALGAASGRLQIALEPEAGWWAWVQLAGLGLLALMAAPSVRRREEASAPRRVAGGAG